MPVQNKRHNRIGIQQILPFGDLNSVGIQITILKVEFEDKLAGGRLRFTRKFRGQVRTHFS